MWRQSFTGDMISQGTEEWVLWVAVYMGQGEPCLNWRAVLASAEFINRDIGVGARHITISTVGVPNSMRLLAQALKERSLQVTLAVSIHAPFQEIREKIVPR